MDERTDQAKTTSRPLCRRMARVVTTVLLALLTAGVLGGCSGKKQDSSVAETRELTLVSYAVPDKAYKKIIPAFRKYWKDKTGQDVRFTESYGGSGSQSRAVIDGLEADIVNLAMEPDVEKISKAGLIEPGWQERTRGKGIATTSLIVIGVRPGNPRKIADWADISKAGVGVITPDPKTSGGARWNLLATYGAVTQNGGSEKDAYDQTRSVFENALVLDKNAREASNTFLKKGLGDAALLWESDANIGRAEGEEFDVVIPKSTILAETAVTVVDEVVDRKGTRDVAEAFVEFLFTSTAQRAFAETGLRPVDETVLAEYKDDFPQPETKLFSISDFGGWKAADPKYFDEGGVYSKIEADVAAKK